ncbi:MAG: phosphoheptose isomerase family protein [Candidatus Latescibacterota bacterium]
MHHTSRRDLLRNGALLGAGALTGNVPPLSAAVNGHTELRGGKWDDEYDFGHRILFMEEYLRGTLEILGSLSGELEHIGELSDRAVSVIKAGGTVWNSANIGHMPGTEQSVKRVGNPGVMKPHSLRSRSPEQGQTPARDGAPRQGAAPAQGGAQRPGGTPRQAEAARQPDAAAQAGAPRTDAGIPRKGDMIFTCYCNRSIQAARDQGIYVVTIPVNYVNNEFWPEGYVAPNEDNLMLRDVSNEILHSYIPYEQGLVHPPEIPYMAVCPSCTTALGALYWMLSAEIAGKLADPKAKKVDKSAEYLSILTERVKRIGERHLDAIRETAVEMTRRVRDGGRWFVRSSEHSGLASELVRVASGPWMPNTGDWNARKTRNIMLISGISPAFPEEVRLAREKQVEGAYVIGIGPSSLDGVTPPGRLIDIADAGFDNFSPESAGVIHVPGRKESLCPTSGIMSNIIQQMISAQWADEMCRRGSTPFFLMGNYRGGTVFNRLIDPDAKRRGY